MFAGISALDFRSRLVPLQCRRRSHVGKAISASALDVGEDMVYRLSLGVYMFVYCFELQ